MSGARRLADLTDEAPPRRHAKDQWPREWDGVRADLTHRPRSSDASPCFRLAAPLVAEHGGRRTPRGEERSGEFREQTEEAQVQGGGQEVEAEARSGDGWALVLDGGEEGRQVCEVPGPGEGRRGDSVSPRPEGDSVCALRLQAQLAAVAAIGEGPREKVEGRKNTTCGSPLRRASERRHTARSIEAMTCPECSSSATRVTDTRHVSTGQRRRRECETCGYRFTTYERPRPRLAERQQAAA